MITELKMVIQLLEEQQGNSDYYSIRIDSSINRLKSLLTSLESQEARLREWEVTGSTTRPATFEDMMDIIDQIYKGKCFQYGKYNDYVDATFTLPDGRELRRKG